MRRFVSTLMLATFLAHPALAAEPGAAPIATPRSVKADTSITPAGATWRSAVLPGWGERYKGERKKGWLFTGAFSILALGTIATATEAANADSAYRHLGDTSSNSAFDSAYQRDVRARLSVEVIGGATAALWAWSIADSGFNGVDALRIKDARVHDVFPSQAKFWQTNSFASVVVENRTNDPITNIKLRLEAPSVLSLPAEAAVVETLAPGLAREISLRAAFGDKVFDIGRSEPSPVQARVTVEYETRHKRKKIERTATFTVYNRNAIVWDDVRKLASFVTPRETAVLAFASDAARRKTQLSSIRNLSAGAVYFDAMSAAGITYLSDPSAPFAQLEGNAAAVDTVSFPHETLARRTGDCDDLTALYASLLESSGIPSAIVDVPGHVFVMFDSGVKPDEFHRQTGNDRYVLRGGNAWIPVEITAVGKPFNAAWGLGIDEAKKWIGLSKLNAVDVLAAQTTFPPAVPMFGDAALASIDGAAFDKLIAQDGAKQNAAETDAEKSALADLKARHLPPDQEANEIGVFLAKQGQYKVALTWFQKAIALNPRLAKAKNNLGNVAMVLGDRTAALKAYQDALDIGGDDAAVLANLAYFYYDIGEPKQAVEYFRRAEKLDPAYALDFPEIASLAHGAPDSATVQRPGSPGTAPAARAGEQPDPKQPGKFIP